MDNENDLTEIPVSAAMSKLNERARDRGFDSLDDYMFHVKSVNEQITTMKGVALYQAWYDKKGTKSQLLQIVKDQ